MSYLAHAQRWMAQVASGDGLLPEPLEGSAIPEVREQIGAALIRSDRFGEVWVALTEAMAVEIRTDQQTSETPRPVLLAEDVARLRGKPETAVRAVLLAAAVFPGARVVQ